MIVNFTHPPDFTSGGAARSDQWTTPLAQLEGLLQDNVYAENVSSGSALRRVNFRESGLTEVWRRAVASEPWVVRVDRNGDRSDMPGGALHFRLRAPASVIVFYIAKIVRASYPAVTTGNSGSGPDSSPVEWPDISIGGSLSEAPGASGGFGATASGTIPSTSTATPSRYFLMFEGRWEGQGEGTPGTELVQATSIIRGDTKYDRPDEPRQVFMAWQPKPSNVTPSFSVPPEVSDGAPGVVPVYVRTRTLGGAGSSQLQAGWHTIRHTATERYKGELNGSYQNKIVVGNTELIVIADYGPVLDDQVAEETGADHKRTGGLVGDGVRKKVGKPSL